MKDVVIPRLPAGCYLAALAMAVAQVYLCYPAATSRGYPAIPLVWEWIAPYVGYVGVALIPLFDNRRHVSRPATLLATLLMAVPSVLAISNVMGPTPRSGSSFGMLGPLASDFPYILLPIILMWCVAVPLCMWWESKWNETWNRVRDFSDESPNLPPGRISMRALLVIVAVVSIGLFLATALWKAYDTLPSGWALEADGFGSIVA